MKNLLSSLMFLAAAAALTSCSITQGSLSPTSHYVYPNSNVTPLGSTNAKVSKFGFIFPPRFRAKDLDQLYGDALGKHSGADIIINNRIDSKNTSLMIFHFMKVTLAGTAAKMEVGKQDIGHDNFVPENNTVAQQQQPGQQQSSGNAAVPYEQNAQQQSQYAPVIKSEEKKERAPLKPIRLGIQANYVSRDYMKPGIGLNAEIFFSKRFSIAPSFNSFFKQRIDLGFGMGTYELKQSAFYTDVHCYVMDKVASVYVLTSISYEKTKLMNFQSSFPEVQPGSQLGLGVGAGVHGNFLSNKLHPFLEVKYVTLSSLTYQEYSPESETNARLSWGVKYSLGN